MTKPARSRGGALVASLVAIAGAHCATVHDVADAPPRVAADSKPPSPPASPPAFARVDMSRTGSSVVLARSADRTVAYVADSEESSVRTVDVDRSEELATTPLEGAPAQLLILADGKVAVTLRDRAAVLLLCPGDVRASLVACGRVVVADEPIGLALTPDDRTLLVTSGWAHTLTGLDAATLQRRFDQDVPREPRAVVVSDDGKRAYISHAVRSPLTVVELDNPIHPIRAVSIDGHNETSQEGGLMVGEARKAIQGYALAKAAPPARGRILAPIVMAFEGDTTVRSSGYGSSETPAELFDVAVVDEGTSMPLADSLLLHRDDTSCLLPRAAAVGHGGALFVACFGVDKVAEFDATAADPISTERRHWRVPSGPAGLAVDDAHERIVVWSQFARALSTLDVRDDGHARGDTTTVPSVSIALSRRPEAVADPDLALGRVLFHAVGDSRISSDGRACASCHPDGRDDGMTWSTPNGPRQTPSLAGRLDGTAPYAWDGDGATLAKHLGHTMKRLRGSGLPDRERDALVAYVSKMQPAPVATIARDAVLARGSAVFHAPETGCATCHGMDGAMPDGDRHDVGSRAKSDASAKFDTPSLRFVAGTAPYFHDGRYPTLRAVLEQSDGKMGHVKGLSPTDIDALEAYVRTL